MSHMVLNSALPDMGENVAGRCPYTGNIYKSGQTPNNTEQGTPKSQSWRPVLPARPKKELEFLLLKGGGIRAG